MTRTIKLKSWDKFENRMITWEDMICTKESEKLIIESLLNSARYIPIQFTGLLDRNGVEIYEGDIIFHPIQGKLKVEYGILDRVACFGLENTNKMRNILQDSEYLYEVIGNIYENPELLSSK